MDTTISAYHSADCPEVIRGVACSGGIGADGRPVAGLVPAILGVHAPSRQLTRALPPASPADRATSATLALYAFGDDSHHLPAPSRGKKERKLF